jgi:hypothetical protein
MSNDRFDVLDRLAPLFEAPEPSFETFLRRRDRKRRNQRISAGVVGIAVFVAAIWIVTSGGVFNRSETSVVPAEDVTGPAVTEPTETGPAETGPAETGPPEAPFTGSEDNGYYRIPPAGTVVSTPVEGELIAAKVGGPAPGDAVRGYADGRVLSAGGPHIVERRLSPEGVELVRSGMVQPEDFLGPSWYLVPESAWEDRDGKPYVPARYGACFWGVEIPPKVEARLDLLPASAQALLRGSDRVAENPRCFEVTPETARSLEEILSEARPSAGDLVLREWEVGAWRLRDGNRVFITLRPLFPDGRIFFQPPW